VLLVAEEGTDNNTSTLHTSQEDDFFGFKAQPENSSSFTAEVDAYLNDPSKDVIALQKYSHVKKLFLKFNTDVRTERQSARMSKITNDVLTRSGTGCFIAVPIWQQ